MGFAASQNRLNNLLSKKSKLEIQLNEQKKLLQDPDINHSNDEIDKIKNKIAILELKNDEIDSKLEGTESILKKNTFESFELIDEENTKNPPIESLKTFESSSAKNHYLLSWKSKLEIQLNEQKKLLQDPDINHSNDEIDKIKNKIAILELKNDEIDSKIKKNTRYRRKAISESFELIEEDNQIPSSKSLQASKSSSIKKPFSIDFSEPLIITALIGVIATIFTILAAIFSRQKK